MLILTKLNFFAKFTELYYKKYVLPAKLVSDLVIG